jgi:hypothetical protein
MKDLRIKFLPGQQSRFLTAVLLKSGLSTEKLATVLRVHPRSLRDWKREKLTMPLDVAELFCKEFELTLPEDQITLIDRWKTAQSIANKSGGLARFAKYGSPATEEGRRRGGIHSIANLRRNGIVPKLKIYKIPNVYSIELAEFTGILLGDGGITPGQVTITLNSEKDYKYSNYVAELGQALFGEKPKIFLRKNEKTLVLYYNGSELVRYLVSIGLIIGNKVKQQVGVPLWVSSSKVYSKACLKGLMDTDGGVFLHKYKVRGRVYSYKKISFTNRSLPLLHFVKKSLEELKFNPKMIDKVENKKVWLYNMQEVERYLEVVGTSNSRLLKLNGG